MGITIGALPVGTAVTGVGPMGLEMGVAGMGGLTGTKTGGGVTGGGVSGAEV